MYDLSEAASSQVSGSRETSAASSVKPLASGSGISARSPAAPLPRSGSVEASPRTGRRVELSSQPAPSTKAKAHTVEKLNEYFIFLPPTAGGPYKSFDANVNLDGPAATE